MAADAALALILRATQLKRVPRTGWVMRGIAGAESVSDHTFGVAFIALVLAQLVEQPVDVAKLLTTAMLHDLPEAVLSDIPAPASQHLPRGAKRQAEREVLDLLLEELPEADRWQAWWEEFEEGSSVEGRLVRDADRLDTLLQAYVYEQTTGNLWLEEFWTGVSRTSLEAQVSQALFDALVRARERTLKRLPREPDELAHGPW